ncbi:peptidoglycan glycosyltransferase FtsW [Luteimicrobium sp. DT211]|uniref:peptidoglycan glycosyltransferase FtsW n=1 Tax=Luteimicrobium sp. DT211 TaxID=3393412 RepID=UPI003CF2626B
MTGAPGVTRAPRATGTRAQAVPAAKPRAASGGKAASRPAKAAARPKPKRSTLATVWDSPLATYYLVAGVTATLLAIGLVMVLSSSAVTQIAKGNSPFGVFLQQAQYALIGIPLLLVAAHVPVRIYKRFAWVGLIGALALQCLVFVPGISKEVGGNRSWIHVGGSVQFQPAEVAKLALVVWLATVLGRKQRLLGQARHAIIPAVPGALLVIGLVLVGKDLGTALVVMMLVVGAFFVAGVPLRLLVAGMGIGGIFVWQLFLNGNSNRGGRISVLLKGCDPNGANAQELCYQTIHGMQALGSGGLTGVGLGASRQAWGYLPAASNDFIFAIIGEELGLLGAGLVLVLVGLLGYACYRVVRRHEDPFAKVAAAAIGCWIVGQSLVNVGVVIGVIPVIGVPLPLISAGGSALVTTLVAMGILLSLARTEPGTSEALAARPSIARRTLGVVAGAGRRSPRTPVRSGGSTQSARKAQPAPSARSGRKSPSGRKAHRGRERPAR